MSLSSTSPPTSPSPSPPSTHPSPLVIIFLRRWGCQLCRGYALKLQTSLLPHLKANSIAYAAVGFERAGAEEFAPFFPLASLYLDEQRRAYNALGLRKISAFSGFMNLVSSSTRAWNNEVKAMGVTGNFVGDGMQLGATYVLSTKGEVWLEHKQQDFADHPSVEQLLAVLEERVPGFRRVSVEGEERKDGSSLGASPKSGAIERIGGGAPKCADECM